MSELNTTIFLTTLTALGFLAAMAGVLTVSYAVAGIGAAVLGSCGYLLWSRSSMRRGV